MGTKEMRDQATALLLGAETSLQDGELEAGQKQMQDASDMMDKAEAIDQAASKVKALQGEFSKPVNTIPIASQDVAIYNPNDTGNVNKASYKPATWVKGLPAMAQPMWVQDQMGNTEKEQARRACSFSVMPI